MPVTAISIPRRFTATKRASAKPFATAALPAQEIFVTTKLWNSDHGNPEQALQRSLGKLKLDYVDLYLIHYPVPERLRSWRILEGVAGARQSALHRRE